MSDGLIIANWHQDGFRTAGFVGFRTVTDLRADRCGCVPNTPGLYAALYTGSTAPIFLATSPGGHFKHRNPTAAAEVLRGRWISETPLVYLGKTGGGAGKGTLRTRLRAYMDFGAGKPIGHWGGRYTWQLASHADLVIAWMPLVNAEPRTIERELLAEFKRTFGRLPYANIIG